MPTIHGKITVAELRADEALLDELVEQLGSTERSVVIELNRHDEDTFVEDIYDFVPDSLRTVKVVEARGDDDLIEEIAGFAGLDADEVADVLEIAHGGKYVHNVVEFPWPQPEDEDSESDDDAAEEIIKQDATRGLSPHSSSSQVDEVLTVLLVSASPDSQVRLRVDQEFRRIIDRIRGSRYRDRLRMVQLQAARFDDLRTALMEHEPHVLHFSGHGENDGSLIFERRLDGSNVVPKKSFLRLLKALGDNLKLVVLNACHSQAVAMEIPPTISLAIGMPNVIADMAAIDFAVALYEALAFNKSVQTAFDAAISGLDEDDVELPQLFADDAAGKRQRPLLSL